MSDLNFITIDSSEIYDTIITALENGCSDELYPGDERRIFGEALVAVIVATFNSETTALRQRRSPGRTRRVKRSLERDTGVQHRNGALLGVNSNR